jgi:hypothetical protein
MMIGAKQGGVAPEAAGVAPEAARDHSNVLRGLDSRSTRDEVAQVRVQKLHTKCPWYPQPL